MKPCSTRWRRWSRRSVLVAVATLASGCVTSGTHSAVVGERDTLQRRVEQLERSTESLDAERVKLIDELEDLRIAQEKLDHDIRSLREAESELSQNLAAREVELASRNSEVEKLRGTYDGLVQDLEAEVAAGEIEIEQLRGGLRLNLTQDVLFSSGSPEVNAGGRRVLAKVAERVKGIPNHIIVRGHTDNVPIASSRFPTNWELAGGRAARVVRLLEKGGVDPSRLSAVSHGETQPRASNATPDGRKRNRRIEITLQPARESAAVAAESEAAAEPETSAAP
jgi:chemotaxis protein MotB